MKIFLNAVMKEGARRNIEQPITETNDPTTRSDEDVARELRVNKVIEILSPVAAIIEMVEATLRPKAAHEC